MMPQWLILVHRIPPRPLYLRAKMRQRLAAAGAVAVKKSVYLLPHGSEALEDLQWIAQEITSGGGDAHLFEGDFVDPAATAAATAQFKLAREADYRSLAAEARAALKGAAGGKLVPVHERLSRKLQHVQRLDFFHAAGRADAEKTIAAIEARLTRDKNEEKRMSTANPGLRGRTWVTRPGVKVDRIASAWFIRRFIDPKARFRFEDPRAPRRERDIRFDMVDGDYTHESDRCTLETLIRRVGLPDQGVRVIAEIVHDIDLKDEKFGRPETPGVAAAIDGLVRRHVDDAARLDHGLGLFDDLHQAFGRTKRARK